MPHWARLASVARTGARVALPAAAVAAVGGAAALLTMGLLSTVRGELGPGRVEARARLTLSGRTEIALPPLGSVSAKSHRAPVLLQAEVTQLDLDRVQRLLRTPDPEQSLRREMEDDIVALGRRLALRGLVAGAVVGAIAGGLLPRRRLWHALTGAAGGAVAVVGLLAVAWQGYDEEAFLEPRFDGPLERAPAVVSAARKHVDSIAAVQDRIDVLSDQVSRLYRTATAATVPDPDNEVRIVHVSDVHSNPLGLEVVVQLVESFNAHAVVDTGDFTSFGLSVETRIAQLVGDIGVPYYLVPGNHDSPANREALAAMPNVTVLDGDVVEIEGISVFGLADPTYTASNLVGTGDANELKLARARVAAAYVRRAAPDVFAVHDRRLASESAGLVPLVLSGHTHARSAETVDGTMFLTVGSTGATGVGSFTVETDLPYEAEVLRFVGDRLVAVDYVKFRGIGGNFTIDRRIVQESDAVPFDGDDDGRPFLDGAGRGRD